MARRPLVGLTAAVLYELVLIGPSLRSRKTSWRSRLVATDITPRSCAPVVEVVVFIEISESEGAFQIRLLFTGSVSLAGLLHESFYGSSHDLQRGRVVLLGQFGGYESVGSTVVRHLP